MLTTISRLAKILGTFLPWLGYPGLFWVQVQLFALGSMGTCSPVSEQMQRTFWNLPDITCLKKDSVQWLLDYIIQDASSSGFAQRPTGFLLPSVSL